MIHYPLVRGDDAAIGPAFRRTNVRRRHFHRERIAHVDRRARDQAVHSQKRDGVIMQNARLDD